MKRTNSGSFVESSQAQSMGTTNISDHLLLYVALSPNQKKQFDSDEEVTPDEKSGRFGLRSTAAKAVERAHKFMNWKESEEDQKLEIPEAEFVLYSIKISALGFLVLTESNVLERGDGQDHFRVGYYRWIGSLSKSRSAFVDGVERNLFTMSAEIED